MAAGVSPAVAVVTDSARALRQCGSVPPRLPPDRLALFAAGLCTALAPLQALIWYGQDAPAWLAGLLPLLGDPQTFVAASTVDQPGPLYFMAGRVLWLPYAALLLVLARLPTGVVWIRRGLVAAVATAWFGDVLSYGWSQLFGPGLRALGFWRIEVPALVLALGLLTWMGVDELLKARRRGASGSTASMFAALLVPATALTVAVLQYLPHGLLLPISWAVALQLRNRSRPSTSPYAWRQRLRWLGLSSVGVLATLLISLPYRPVVISGPNVEAGSLGLPTSLPSLRLHVFNTGANRMSSLLVGEDPPWRAAPAFVIEHPTVGLVVFDCGLSPAVAAHGEQALPAPLRWLFESRGRPGLTLDAQMLADGLVPATVRQVVVSHLHADHTGVAAAFTHAAFTGGPGSRELALFGPHSPFDPAHQPHWREFDDSNGRALGPFESAVDLFDDGSVWLIDGGGHTAHDTMMLLNLPDGPVLLAGDAVVHHDWLRSDDVERIAMDPERAATVRNQVRAFVDSGQGLLIPGHDLRHLGRERSDVVRHHPELFATTAWPTVGD